MKKSLLQKLSFIAVVLFFTLQASAQNPQNWTDKQLMPPAKLAQLIEAKKEVPLVVSVGPGSAIPNSVEIGMVSDAANLDILKKQLIKWPKDTSIVVYCGCCPYQHCPNVRPAIAALKELKFTNYYLLDLPNNIKKDWIDKGYPTLK